jgi:hypothetical protein
MVIFSISYEVLVGLRMRKRVNSIISEGSVVK